MKIRLTQSALSDLEELQTYYKSQHAEEIGIRFVKEIISHIETLKTHPKIGRIVPEFDDESIREIIHKPFRVVYLLKGEMIYVIRVWRGERLLILSDEVK